MRGSVQAEAKTARALAGGAGSTSRCDAERQNVAAGLRALTGVKFGHAEGWFDPIAGQGCGCAAQALDRPGFAACAATA
jgi:hypothetical protein